MFCGIHKERIAIGTCAGCEAGLCTECQTMIGGRFLCPRCAADLKLAPRSLAYRNPFFAAALSFLPGIGQVYNGQLAKGILVFLLSPVVIPWIYGIVDAYIVAEKINRGDIADRRSAGCLIGCVVLVFLVIMSPVLAVKAFQYFYLMAKVKPSETIAINQLLEISDAAERFARDHHGEYPASFSELYFADSPYLKDIVCDVTLRGCHYTCVFSKKGYMITATPVEDIFVRKTPLTVTTGGLVIPEAGADPSADGTGTLKEEKWQDALRNLHRGYHPP